eukprot:scaffold167922_cov51-Prasinocladus_malaysianus.AAC.2
MKTQDGLETVKRDPTFLAEREIIPRATVERLMPDADMKLTSRNTYQVPAGEEKIPYHKDLGVSVYSEAVFADTYKGTHVHKAVNLGLAMIFALCFTVM